MCNENNTTKSLNPTLTHEMINDFAFLPPPLFLLKCEHGANVSVGNFSLIIILAKIKVEV